MHFSGDISLGQILTLIGLFTPLVGVLLWLGRIDRKMGRFMIEHEMIMADLAERKGVPLNEFPTRQKPQW